jgi:hypothetical protein
MDSYTLVLPKFPTHIFVSKKKAMKLGYNNIHAGINHYVREKTVKQLHDYIEEYLPTGLKIDGPVGTRLIIYVPINFGSVRMLKGEIRWKVPDKTYKPNWDLDNLAFVWLKILNDSLVSSGIIPEDTVEYLQGTLYKVEFVSTFEERKLVYKIFKLNQ